MGAVQDERENTVAQHRAQIDRIDEQILELLNRRAEHALAIGAIKKERGTPVHVPEREEAVLRRLEGLNRGPLPARGVEEVFRAVFAQMRSLEGSVGGATEREVADSSH